MSNETPQSPQEPAGPDGPDESGEAGREESPSFDRGEPETTVEQTPATAFGEELEPGAADAVEPGEADPVERDEPDAWEPDVLGVTESDAVADSPETFRVDDVPVDVGEPEPAVEAPATSTDAVTEAEYVFESDTAAYDATAEQDADAYPPSGAFLAGGAAAAGSAAATGATTPAQTPVYVTAPTAPRAKGNRAMGILIAVVAAVAYAVVFAAVALGIFALRDVHGSVTLWESYLQTAGFWVPVVVFFLAYALVIAIVNRGGWWAYAIGSFFVGVIVYFGYLGGALLTVQAWTLTSGQAGQFIGTLWANPLTFAAAVVAREASLWFGGWIAARGRRVRERNVEAQRDYDRRVQAGPTA